MIPLRPLRQPLRLPLRLKLHTYGITTPTTPISSRVYAHMQADTGAHAPAQIPSRSIRSVSSNKGLRRSEGRLRRSSWRRESVFSSEKEKL